MATTKKPKKKSATMRPTKRNLTPHQKLEGLCRELDAELDGVQLPWSAAAIVGGIREVLGDIENPVDCFPGVERAMHITGKQFENLCTYRMAKEEKIGRGWMKRAGVNGAQLIGRGDLTKDIVDFIGEADGMPFKFDAKTCCTASFELREVTFKRGQYDELKAFAGVAFLLIHFNPQQLAQVRTEAATYAFPIQCEFWRGYESGETKSINRADCLKWAVPVRWNTVTRSKKLSPDIVRAVKELVCLTTPV